MSRYAAGGRSGNLSLLTDEGVLIEGFEDATEWGTYGGQAAGSAVADNTTDFHAGTQSVSFTSTASGTVRYNHYDAAGVDLSDVDTFSLWVKWDKVDSNSNFTLYLSSDGNTILTNRVSLTVTTTTTGNSRSDGGPICLTFKKGEMTPSGTIDWSSVKNINVAFNMQAADEFCSLDSFYCGRRTRPKLVMCIDDNVQSGDFDMITQAGVALTAGIPISFMAIPALVDGAGYLTTAELTTLQTAGHLIAGHSNSVSGNYPTDDYTQAQAQADIESVQTWLEANGFLNGKDFFAWPGGAFEDTSPVVDYLPAARAAGLKAARSITAVVQTNNKVEKLNLGLIEPLVINAASINDTPSNLLAEVDKAISHGASIFFYGHKISTGAATPAGYEITGNDFSTFCDGIKVRVDKGLIDAVTFKAFYDGYSYGHTRSVP